MKDISSLHSYHVCAVINKIENITTQLEHQRWQYLEQHKQLEVVKDEMLNDGKGRSQSLLNEKEKLMDIKREREFVVTMLEHQNGRVSQREISNMDDIDHKIQILKLRQDKIKEESK